MEVSMDKVMQEYERSLDREFAIPDQATKTLEPVILAGLDTVFKDCREIVRCKNQDYADSQTDPFKNFRNSIAVGVPIERGILVRIMDKISRVSNLLDRDAVVVDESLEDSLKDAINYLALLLIYHKSDKKS